MARKKLQKAFALLLTFSMLMSLLSVTAFADEPETHEHNPVTCAVCGGSGKETVSCETCGGSGSIQQEGSCSKCGGEGKYWEFWIPCETCEEVGTLPDGSDCPDCDSGYTPGYLPCDVCEGSGKVTQTSPCENCNGEGSILTVTPCATCEGAGTVPCTSSVFDKSELTHVECGSDKAVTGGTMTHTCSVCEAFYEEPLDAETVYGIMAQELSVKEYTVNSSIANAGQKLTYSLKITNNNAYNLPNIQVQVEFPEGLTFTPYSKNAVVYYSGSYKGTGAMPTYSAASAEYDEGTRVLTLTVPGIIAGRTLEAKFCATVEEDVTLGVDLAAALSATAGGEEAPGVSGSVNTHVNKYTGTKNIYLAGAKMAGWYNPGNPTYTRTATTTIGNTNTSLDALEGATFSFEGAFNKDQNPTTGYVRHDTTDAKYYGERLKNSYDNRIWQCVGFVPYWGSIGNGDYDVVAAYVYTDAENNEGFQVGSLEDAVQYVKDQNGVLYGQAAAEENIRALEHNISQSVLTIMTVWYVAEPEPLEKGEYGELTIDPVSPLDPKPTSQDVTLALGDVTKSKEGVNTYFDAELIVTIGTDAPRQINVNMEEILAKAFSAIDSIDHNQVQPGDTLRFHIQVVNNSGRDYHYVEDSVQISTVDYYTAAGNVGSLGTGFDGFQIADNGAIPARQLNPLLQELGVTSTSDAAIGAALKAEGYGEGEDLTAAEITQKYLGHYYLDYFNRSRADGNKAESFQDLTITELAMLTNVGVYSGAQKETCQDVAEALYYFYYGEIYRFSGVALYDHMKDNSKLDQGFAAALDADEPYILLFSTLAGEEMNNAFQNTYFGFTLQFQMAVSGGSIDDGDDDNDPRPPHDDDDDDDDTNIPDENTPTTDLPDPETPTTELPEEETPTTDIPEEDTPLAEVPETGDVSALWLALTALSGTGLAGVTFLGRKKREDQ